MKRDKIAVVIYANPDDYAVVFSGIAMLSKDWDPVVICRNQNPPQRVYPGNVKVIRLGRLMSSRGKEGRNFLRKIIEYCLFVVHVCRLVRKSRCVLVYSYDMHGFIAAFCAARLGKKVNVVYHNLDMYAKSGYRNMGFFIHRLELFLARFADKVVFCDTYRARYFQGKARLAVMPQVVYNSPLKVGVLPASSLRQFLQEKGYLQDTKVACYRGALDERHGILQIIRSMRLWPQNSVLVLFGRREYPFIEKMNKEILLNRLNNRVILFPFIAYDELAGLTAGADAGFALYKPVDINYRFMPGASQKIFEYMSLGIPVITNDSPYFRKVLGEPAACFVNPESIEEIGKAVGNLFSNDQEKQKRSYAARQLHLERFHYENQFLPVREYLSARI